MLNREDMYNGRKKPLHGLKKTVGCGFIFSVVNGHFIFEKLNEGTFQTVSVTGKRYAKISKNEVTPHLHERSALHFVTFIQDGALPQAVALVENSQDHIWKDPCPGSTSSKSLQI